MAPQVKRLVRSIYAPPRGKERWSFNSLVGHDRVRYFRLGRHALQRALLSANIRKGDNVLIPGLICNEVPAAVQSIGAIPLYYPVNEQLGLSFSVDRLPSARAVVAVNYFGFPQSLAVFEEYSARMGAILIEDNAHGLFSRDADGRPLGARGDYAIFSFHKTLPLWDGAALVINNSPLCEEVAQLPFGAPGEPLLFKMKQMLRGLVPFVGISPARFATLFVRRLRSRMLAPLTAVHEGSSGDLDGDTRPAARMLAQLSFTDPASEIARRRQLYEWTGALLSKTACRPVFPVLPQGVAPYGFPFYMRKADVPRVRRCLSAEGLDLFQWPDLPAAVQPDAPPHYTSLWCVQFLW
jgi:perosamine synthetase